MNIEELQQDVEDLTRNCNRLFDENRELKKQLAGKDKEIAELKETINDLLLTTIDHESFYLGITDAVVAALEKVKEFNSERVFGSSLIDKYIDQLINEAKGDTK